MYQSKIAEVRDFQRYMTVRLNCAAKTAEGYARDLDRFATYIAPRPLLKAKAKHITAWTDGLMEDGSNKPQSIHRKIAAIAGFFKYARLHKLTKKNPMEEVEKPKCGKRLPMCMTTDEVTAVLDAVDRFGGTSPFFVKRARAIMELLYGSGLRRSETLDLTLNDIDLESGRVHLVGKGDKERFSFLSEAAITAIREWLAVRPEGCDALFTKRNGKKLSARQGWVIFRTIADNAGLKKHVVPHTMRHSYATHMIESGADIMTIKELLGHASVATTQVYTNVSLAHQRKTYLATHPRAGKSPNVTPSVEEETTVPYLQRRATKWSA